MAVDTGLNMTFTSSPVLTSSIERCESYSRFLTDTKLRYSLAFPKSSAALFICIRNSQSLPINISSPSSISIHHAHLELTARRPYTAHAPLPIHFPLDGRLLMLLAKQHALVEVLRAGRHVERRVLGEEVDGLEGDFEDLAGHYWEVFDTRDLCRHQGQ